MKKKIYTVLFWVMLTAIMSGCKKRVNEKTIYFVGKNVNKADVVETIEEKPEESDYRNLAIGFVNKFGVDIGMISVIDPVTDEQVNIDGLADGEMITVASIMPKEVTELEWAVYNNKGELYCSNKTDISNASESVYVIMSGSGSMDDIMTVFDKTEDEVKEAVNNMN